MTNLKVETTDRITLISIDRPDKLNALDRETMIELAQALGQLLADDDVLGAIITGTGEKAFVAGADINELRSLNPVDAVEFSRFGHRIFRAIELARKPIIAAVNGFALGGGCELALACHLRIASSNARFGLPEVKLGVIPGYGGTVRLPRVVGKGRALELILTGKMIDAEEAYRIGLVNQLVAPETLLQEARAVLETILKNGPLALSAAIEATTRGMEMDTDDAIALESNLFALLSSTEDMKEGTAAFVEKRRAEFRGR